MKPKALAYGLGAYNNPQMYYDSPAIHRVSLRDLRPGARYGYRVAGDARNFSFTMPPDAADGAAAYPLTLGLTADLGQTAVSEANTRLLLAAQKHGGVVLLAGDLSYADGYPWRWDTFGRMLEPLAARVPVMTAGGNHDVDLGEAWLAYNTRCRRRPTAQLLGRAILARNSLSSLRLPPQVPDAARGVGLAGQSLVGRRRRPVPRGHAVLLLLDRRRLPSARVARAGARCRRPPPHAVARGDDARPMVLVARAALAGG